MSCQGVDPSLYSRLRTWSSCGEKAMNLSEEDGTFLIMLAILVIAWFVVIMVL